MSGKHGRRSDYGLQFEPLLWPRSGPGVNGGTRAFTYARGGWASLLSIDRASA